MVQLNADLSGHEAQEGFEVRAPGWYPAHVVDTAITQKEGKSPCIVVEFELEDGKPGKVWDYLSMAHTVVQSGKIVRDISLSKLKSIATYGGHKNPNYIADTEEIHGLRLEVKLKIEKDKEGEYEDKNKISAYRKASGNNVVGATRMNPTPTQSQPVQGPAVTPPAQKVKMPWES